MGEAELGLYTHYLDIYTHYLTLHTSHYSLDIGIYTTNTHLTHFETCICLNCIQIVRIQDWLWIYCFVRIVNILWTQSISCPNYHLDFETSRISETPTLHNCNDEDCISTVYPGPSSRQLRGVHIRNLAQSCDWRRVAALRLHTVHLLRPIQQYIDNALNNW